MRSDMADPKPFDLAVCYRIYPGVSRDPIFDFKEKLPLVRLNLETFRESLGDLKVKLWVLLDKCPPPYADLLKELFPATAMELVPLPGVGNGPTFLRQVEILGSQNDADLVYFAEDDYLYLPGALEKTVSFMRRNPMADFVTAYDHPDFYSKYVHQVRGPEVVMDGCRWRTVTSTCLTFMARREAVVASAPVFRTYNRNPDLAMWMSLTKRRVANPWAWVRSLGDGKFFAASHALAWWYGSRQIVLGRRHTLWAPSPSLITHMETGGLAPGVDWEKLFGARAAALQRTPA